MKLQKYLQKSLEKDYTKLVSEMRIETILS